MTLGRKFNLFTIALFLIFAGLSTCCYGDCDCGQVVCGIFDRKSPTRYKVSFSGIISCCKQDNPPCDPPPDYNGAFTLECGSCGWSYSNPEEARFVNAWVAGGIMYVWYNMGESCDFFIGSCSVDKRGYATCSNSIGCCYDSGCGCTGFSGTAEFTPIWDCEGCDCEPCCDVKVSDYDKVMEVGHLDCCPVRGGGYQRITISCPGASYVLPTYSSAGGVIKRVSSEPPECCQGSSATFTIETQPGRELGTVTCTAVFFQDDSDCVSSKTVTVNVIPCGDCCETDNIPKCKNTKLGEV